MENIIEEKYAIKEPTDINKLRLLKSYKICDVVYSNQGELISDKIKKKDQIHFFTHYSGATILIINSADHSKFCGEYCDHNLAYLIGEENNVKGLKDSLEGVLGELKLLNYHFFINPEIK